MIVITLSIKGFTLILCVFLEKTRVFLKKREKYSVFKIGVKHIKILHVFQPSMRGYIKCQVKY